MPILSILTVIRYREYDQARLSQEEEGTEKLGSGKGHFPGSLSPCERRGEQQEREKAICWSDPKSISQQKHNVVRWDPGVWGKGEVHVHWNALLFRAQYETVRLTSVSQTAFTQETLGLPHRAFQTASSCICRVVFMGLHATPLAWGPGSLLGGSSAVFCHCFLRPHSDRGHPTLS